MTNNQIPQLNKIQIKAEILTAISKFQTGAREEDLDKILSILEAQNDKKAILELLLKEFTKANEHKAIVIGFLFIKLCEKDALEAALWELLKNSKISDLTKSVVLNVLRELGAKIEYDNLNDYFDNPDEVIDADTKKLLHTAIVNPEAQIDFMDFLKSLSENDKEVLINSLGEDYTSDALANIINPLFLYSPESALGKISAEILGETKSQLALHALLEAKDFVEDEETLSVIKKSISKLKLAGVRQDNTIDFYKNILSESRPYKSYTSYPDGHGNQAIMFSRDRDDESVQFIAVVINDKFGIVDCFGFNNISKVEFEKIVDRFYSDDERVYINHTVLRTLLDNAENLTRKIGETIPYEYICWKTLFLDIPTDPVSLNLILSMNFKTKELTEEGIKEIYDFDFIQRWFIDVDDNQQFKDFIEDLNGEISKDNFDFDLDKLTDENIGKILDKSETAIFEKRLEMSAYLKYLSGKNEDAIILYSISKTEKIKSEILKNIIKKSIYEHYVAKKFKQEESKRAQNIFAMKNNPTKESKLTKEQISKMISKIESLWVNG